LQELRGKEINRLEEERFTEVFANYQRKLTTPHVLTEVFKLREYSQLKRHEPISGRLVSIPSREPAFGR
jgi:hypothetical protein